jgi:hypothetical protein
MQEDYELIAFATVYEVQANVIELSEAMSHTVVVLA